MSSFALSLSLFARVSVVVPLATSMSLFYIHSPHLYDILAYTNDWFKQAMLHSTCALGCHTIYTAFFFFSLFDPSSNGHILDKTRRHSLIHGGFVMLLSCIIKHTMSCSSLPFLYSFFVNIHLYSNELRISANLRLS